MSEDNWSQFSSVPVVVGMNDEIDLNVAPSVVVAAISDESDEFGGFEAADTLQTDVQTLGTPSHWLLLATNAATSADSHGEPGMSFSSTADLDTDVTPLDLTPDIKQEASVEAYGSKDSADFGGPAVNEIDRQQSCTSNETTLRLDAERLARCEDAERCLAELRLRVREQEERYNEQQARHAKDLESMRQAGQTALALIVEGHKEHLKLCLLQQQELSSTEFKSKLDKEVIAMQEMCENQKRLFELMQAEALEKQREAVQLAIGKVRDELTAQNEAALLSQKLSHEQQLAVAAQEERERTGHAVSAAVDAERERWQELARQLRSEFEPMLAKVRDNHMKEVQDELQAERERAKTFWGVWAEDSKCAARQSAKEAVEAAKQDFDTHLVQRKKAEQCVMQKSLATADLLIEGLRQQLKILTDDSEQYLETRSPGAP